MMRIVLVLSCFAIGCSSSSPGDGADAGAGADAGPEVDAGPVDAGSPDAGWPDAGSPADAGPTSSHGHGGVPCASTGTVTQNGTRYTYCLANIGSAQVKIVEPAAGAPAPLRLALYLHGDGAGPYNSGLALRLVAPWTTTHNVLYAAVRAPNQCAWWLKPSYTTCDNTTPVPDDAKDTGGENATALTAVIDALRAGWDVADVPVLFGGSSGGSIFLTSSFLPLHGDRWPGAYALSCGGDVPWGAPAWDASNAALRGPTKLFFTYGDKDFLAPDIARGVAYYQGLGVPVDVKVVPETGAAGSTHCGNVNGTYSYDQIGRVAEVWGAYAP
jgi:hypothetical protein